MTVERWIELGTRALDAKDYAQARVHFSKALALDAGSSTAAFYLGLVEAQTGHPAQALRQYQRCVALGGAGANLYNNIAVAELGLGRAQEAELSYARALELQIDHPQACAGLGRLLQERGEFDAALDLYDRVPRESADGYLAGFHKSQILLARGELRQGFKWYASRPNRLFSAERNRHTLFRGALPQRLNGAEVLILSERTGIGEDLFFARFFPALKTRGARTLFRCSGRARALLQASNSVDAFVSEDEPATSSYTLFAGDLPYALQCWKWAAVPPPLPLRPDAAALEQAGRLLGACGPPPWIGLTWRAGTEPPADPGEGWVALFKHAPLEHAVAQVARLGGTLLAVQRRVAGGELADFAHRAGVPIVDFSAHTVDLALTLAIMAALERYVCVPNTHLHLRIAAGGTCHILEPFPPDWRLGHEGDVSPWYPGCSIYRQTKNRSWDAAFDRLRADLTG